MVPDLRIRVVNDAPLRPARPSVLYWMTAARRTRANFALQRATGYARELGRPLVVLEALNAGYPWASLRFHRFAVDGMRDNRAALAGRPGVTYLPYLEPAPGAGRGLLARLAADAAVVVTDDFPISGLPAMLAAAARQIDVRLEAIDGNGLLPLRAFDTVFTTAHAFRRALQKVMATHLGERPEDDPLGTPLETTAWPLPADLLARWPDAHPWLDDDSRLATLPIDRAVGPTAVRGGSAAAHQRLYEFVTSGLPAYGTDRNVPDRDVSSRLSPYLHWGHISAHEVFDRVMAHDGWLGLLPRKATGGREGWWGVSPAVDGFLDQLVTWRELGYNLASKQPDHTSYESLPHWARRSLDHHASDPRDHVYDFETFERAATHDPLWNAAQTQLIREGRIHNYLRMLWGKKILEWTHSPRQALEVMFALNDKYALDGRNPNSCSGITWILGRYDRPWGPERPVFGVVRYMSSENTARKVRVKDYLRRYGAEGQPL